MADKKISELTAITAANTAADDVFAVVDTSSTETKKISRDELKTAVAQSGAEIKAAYEAEANAFTDAQFTKLAGIETSADVTDTTNVTAAGALMDSEVTNLAQVKAFDSADYATAAQGTTADAALPRTGGAMTGAITTNSTFDGRDVATDGAKLDGIAAGANNYVHPNHTGEVTSTADGATVIADNVVDEANLKVSNAPTNGYALTAQSAAAGGLTWAAVSGGSYSDSDVDTHLNTSTASASEVLSWTGSDYDWVAQSGGGGADLYAANESSPAAQPSATGGNAIAIGDSAVSSGDDAISLGVSKAGGDHSFAAVIANGTSSYGAIGNYSIAIGFQAKASNFGGAAFGKGATTAGLNYNVALGNSYTSGADAFAAAIASNSSSYGATGSNSIAIGYRAKATGAKSIALSGENATATGASSFAAGGEYPTASGAYSVAIGGSVNTASGEASYAFGKRALAAQTGKYAYGAFLTGTNGATQGGMMILNAATTDATATVLSSDSNAAGSANQIVAASDTAITFDGSVTGIQNGAQAFASFLISGLLVNDGGTTTLVNSAITVIDNQSSWVVAMTADNTNNALAVTVTGEASHNIRWVANIRTSEVTYA
jgi:hypothetical protein